jgi:hypothetical protein
MIPGKATLSISCNSPELGRNAKTYRVKRQFAAATTKTHHGGRKETAHIKGSTRRPKIGRVLAFTPPGVVKIFTTGLALKLSTTMIPATWTFLKRLKTIASASINRSMVRIAIRKELDPANAAG